MRATLKPYWTWASAFVLTTIVWFVLIHGERNEDIDDTVAMVNGSLWTAFFFGVPLAQVMMKLFGRVAGPAKNRLARAVLALTVFICAFGLLAVLIFSLVAVMGWAMGR
ncbi:MAG: hypothetical protein ACXWQO_03810 [Bdellovibrionota bacterium]